LGKSVKIGDLAPNFRLLSQTGPTVELKDFIGVSPVVLFFYPKDNTTLCTKEVCYFRDNFDEFKKINRSLVLGISSDTVDSHKQFSEANNLPFMLLSDPNEDVRGEYVPDDSLFIYNECNPSRYYAEGLWHSIFSSNIFIRIA